MRVKLLATIRRVWLTTIVMMLGVAVAGARGQSLTRWTFDDPRRTSEATAVTSDGSVVAGRASGPVTWTRDAGFQSYAAIRDGFRLSSATGVAEDGQTICGYAVTDPQVSFPYYRAFMATSAGSFGLISPLRGYASSMAVGISGDGSTAAINVGDRDMLLTQAARWTEEEGLVGLGGARPGDFHSSATAVSRDGGTIVGNSGNGENTTGFRWTRSAGMVALNNMYAIGVSVDGSVVVGVTTSANGSVAGLWRDGVASALASASSRATSISDDGSIIVGIARLDFYEQAVIFRDGVALRLAEYFRQVGISVPDNWMPTSVTVSGDGRTFVGRGGAPGRSGQGYVAVVPAPGVLIGFGLPALACIARRRCSFT